MSRFFETMTVEQKPFIIPSTLYIACNLSCESESPKTINEKSFQCKSHLNLDLLHNLRVLAVRCYHQTEIAFFKFIQSYNTHTHFPIALTKITSNAATKKKRKKKSE